MTVRLITLSLRQVLRLLLLICRSSRSKDLELLVLRQELAVLRRQVPHPKTKREERLVLTVLQRLRPVHERLSSLFTPDTLRRWRRELVRRKWDGPHRINKRKTVPLETQLVVWRMTWRVRLPHRRGSGSTGRQWPRFVAAEPARTVHCPRCPDMPNARGGLSAKRGNLLELRLSPGGVVPDHLMSVRFDSETLGMLRTLAEIHDTNVAEEVRSAVQRYIEELRLNDDFHRLLDEANESRQKRINQLLGAVN